MSSPMNGVDIQMKIGCKQYLQHSVLKTLNQMGMMVHENGRHVLQKVEARY